MSNKDNSEKLRVYEYAKSLNMSSKEIITILKRLNMPVNNHMSVMEKEAVDGVEKFFSDLKSNAAAKRAAEGAKAAAQAKANASANAQTAGASASAGAAGAASSASSSAAPSQAASGHAQAAGTQQPQRSAGTPSQPSVSSAPSSSAPSSSSSAQSSSARPYNNNGGQSSGQRNDGRPQRPPGQGSGYQGQRPAQGQGSSQGQQRPAQGQGSYNNQNRSSQGTGTGQGGYNSQNRPAAQGASSTSQGGQRSSGGYNSGSGAPRPAAAAGAAAPRFGQNAPSSQGGQRRSSDSRSGQFESSRNQHNHQPKPADPNQLLRKTAVEDLIDLNVTAAKPAGSAAANKKNKPLPQQKRFEDGKGASSFNNRNRSNNKGRYQQTQVKKEKIDNTPKKMIVRGNMTVGEVAKALHKDASEVIKKLLFLGVMATINQELDLEAIQLIASEFKVEVEIKIRVEDDRFELLEEKDDEADLQERPPVVTIMGHVDHGKTTLLDAIRHTSVTEGEAGGITQHIGAYQVEVNGKKITFLDTPGHEAFTSMRARGAQVTDITIIVVAADDGVMPQTVEAIAHAKAAGVPIIVAVNKIDKEGANPEKIKQSLTEYELVPEEWGGDTIFVELSAKQRIGLDNLLEMILLVAEVQEYKANPDKRARGTVIEAELDKGKGPVARVLIQHGTLKVGDSFVAGVCFGRVRAMVNDKGKRLKEAGPSTPVEITGLTEVPRAGDPFLAFEDERKAREIADKRSISLRQSEITANTRVTLDDLYKHIKEGEIKDLNVIIKGDVQGSVEALRGSLEKIEVEGARVKILHAGAGAITESDIILASASSAIIIGFNVRPESAALATAEQEKVDIRLHRIIYNVIEEIEQAMKGMLDPIFKEVILGQAEVRNVFKVTGVGVIAGCMITSGKIVRNAEARLIRGGIVVNESKIDSLKRFKDDAKEVAQGYECGISLEKFNDLKEGDIIEAFIMETVER